MGERVVERLKSWKESKSTFGVLGIEKQGLKVSVALLQVARNEGFLIMKGRIAFES